MLKSYLKYLFHRKNEFRVHSPFVYELYTKVIRGGDEGALKTLGIEHVEQMGEEKIPEMVDKVMYVMEDIHGDKKKEAFWNTICANPDVTLTIDLYKKGLFFYREGMEKQDFVLRR